MTAMDAIRRAIEKLESEARRPRRAGSVGAFSETGRPAWQAHFLAAWRPFVPDQLPGKEFEAALVPMIVGAARYADEHAARYESVIGDDGVLGPHFKDILTGLRGLLNGQLGQLDGGTLDGILCDIAAATGVDLDS